jgi:hypothetical protein
MINIRVVTLSAMLVLAWGVLSSSATSVSAANQPVPVISSLSKTSVVTFSAPFTLDVNGRNFSSTSKIMWNGSALTTQWLSNSALSTVIPTSLISNPETVSIAVYTPAPGGGTSSALSLSVVNSVPVISAVSPIFASVGHAAMTITVTGSKFAKTTAVRWNGVTITTTYVSSTEVTALVPASDLKTAAKAAVTVFTPAPAGGTSSSVTFYVGNPLPILTSISPTTALQYSSGLTLTVTGSDFVSGATVYWNGAKLVTTFVSATRLTAAVAASNLTTSGNVSVAVVNPAPTGGTSTVQTFTVTPGTPPIPAPVATSLSPTSVAVYSAPFFLKVAGSQFTSKTVVDWNGVAQPTQVVSSTLLAATIPTSLVQAPATVSITAVTPSPGGGVSAKLTFSVVNALPVASSVSPNFDSVGHAATTITVSGSNFESTSVVKWNGTALVTTFKSSTSLVAAVPASDLATAGTAKITVTTPAPGGGTSATLTFDIGNPVPVVTSITPSYAQPGAAAFTLTVSGSDFVPTSTILWNGTSVTTHYQNSTTLTASIPASYVAASGEFPVQVSNPAPDGGKSGIDYFSVTSGPPPPPFTK